MLTLLNLWMRQRGRRAALWGCLVLLQTLAVSALDLRPARLNISQQPDGTFLLYWQSQSVVTNTGCTPVYPQYRVLVSSNLLNWRDTDLLVPQRVRGLPDCIQMNFTPTPMSPAVFVRLSSTLNFRGLDMSNCIFSNVDFSGVDFTGARFDGSVLTGAIFKNALLTDVQMNNVTARGAVFDDAKAPRLVATHSDFSQGSWARAVFTNAVLHYSRFTSNIMRYTTMDYVQATNCDFSNAIFNTSSMTNANFTNAVFTGAKFVKVWMERSRFSGANFDHARFQPSTRATSASFYRALLTNTVFDQDNVFQRVEFQAADFTGAYATNYPQTDFRWSDFRGVTNLDLAAFPYCNF